MYCPTTYHSTIILSTSPKYPHWLNFPIPSEDPQKMGTNVVTSLLIISWGLRDKAELLKLYWCEKDCIKIHPNQGLHRSPTTCYERTNADQSPELWIQCWKYRDKDGETDMESREVFNKLIDGGEAKRNPSSREEEKLCHHLHINAFSC